VGATEVVVLDNNVLVSALGWHGPERQIYRLCGAGQLELATSPALLGELKRVLRYPKFQFSEQEIDAFLQDVLNRGRIVRPTVRIEKILEDPDDNRVLECAVSAGADLIVSVDRHLLAISEYDGIPIFTASVALPYLQQSG
jgi:putative PIN family toxin of toxin-antitoxin system